jgi:hypothetical protein
MGIKRLRKNTLDEGHGFRDSGRPNVLYPDKGLEAAENLMFCIRARL